jgi:phenylacetyl-CoA:acceptor oxidoreductase 27-kDa subunit
MTRWAIVADLNRCVGCQTCTAACKHASATAPGLQWRKVLDFEVGEFPDVRRAFLPVGCMHCDEPPCLDVCPSTATRKRDDGIVTIDYDICIGCAYCAVACPYQARFRVDQPAEAYSGKKMRHEDLREDPARIGVAQKCTLCVDRIDDGLARGLTPGIHPAATPACVSSCIAGALHMGDLDDEDSNVASLLRENRHFTMHADLGTGPGIYYLYDGEICDNTPTEPVPILAEPAGLAAVSPRLQTSWDWRAAANFTFGGTGAGLFAAATVASYFAPTLWLALSIALALVGTGLFCVWLEIGRPWRFINVLRHPIRSWMTREAFAVLPFFGAGGLAWVLGSLPLAMIAALGGLAFLYSQARILQAAKGIPAWRQKGIVPLIFSTGLTEGTALFALLVFLAGDQGATLLITIIALATLVLIRFLYWHAYVTDLGNAGAPTGTLKAFKNSPLNLGTSSQIIVLALLAISMVFPLGLPLAVLLALLTGWGFKYTLITKAAFNQGYAINMMPARGAGTSAPGIKPGWSTQ